MSSVSHWIYFSWLNACPLGLVFKTEQLCCGCNYRKSVWHNFVPVTEHIPGMELWGDFFSCLPVELQHRVYISFLHKLACGNECQAEPSPRWVPGCLWQAVSRALCPCGISAPCRTARSSGSSCCALGLMEVCTLRMLFLLEDAPKMGFVPVWRA